ncbi:3-isopropylmalate dehydratase small subunit [Virgibacillus byunsanensis]|uniref:3-isopropylmalate dehydratase small subunit n=1 Tax=Virgibacillus byunsanensis TaxID=570945 RepID=A0ABW3LJ32_9BACI
MSTETTKSIRPFNQITSIVAPFEHANVNTDVILPKQFLKLVKKTGYGEFLFYDWRYLDDGSENPDFILNKLPYRNSSILLTKKNFGSGSSREHAPWSLYDFGIRVIIAPSFADIFYSNCIKNEILPIILDERQVKDFFDQVSENFTLTVNLKEQKITDQNEYKVPFKIDKYSKYMLINGLDEIALTSKHTDKITEFEKHHKIYYKI